MQAGHGNNSSIMEEAVARVKESIIKSWHGII